MLRREGGLTASLTPEARGYETVAGMVHKAMGRILETGEHVDLLGRRFEVVDLDGCRIDKVLVYRPRPDPEDGQPHLIPHSPYGRRF